MALFQTLTYTLEAVPQMNPYNLTLSPTENLNPRTKTNHRPRPNSIAEHMVRRRGDTTTRYRVRTSHWTYVHFPVRHIAPSIRAGNIPSNQPTRRVRLLQENIITTFTPSRPVETAFVLTTPRHRYPTPEESHWTLPPLHGHMHIDFSHPHHRPINNASMHSEPIAKRQRQHREPKPRYPELASRFPKIELRSLDDNAFDFMNAASFPRIQFVSFDNDSTSQGGVSTNLMDFLNDTLIPDAALEFANNNAASLDVLHGIFVHDVALELFDDNDA